MVNRKFQKLLLLVFTVACLLFQGSDQAFGQGPTPPPGKKMGKVTPADRQAAADRAAAARKARGLKPAGPTAPFGVRPDCTPGAVRPAAPKFTPGGTPDYFGIYPNYANSQLPELDCSGNIVGGTGIRKFVDALPGLGAASANELGQYIPVAIPDKTTYPALFSLKFPKVIQNRTRVGDTK
jgi:hypothetical protein